MKIHPTLLKYLCILALVILLSSLAVRFLTRGETLSDYASQNPEIAYDAENKVTFDAENEVTYDIENEVNETEEVPETSMEAPVTDLAKEEPMHPNRSVYQEGFFYEPIGEDLRSLMKGVSYQENPHITYDDLRYLNVLYYDFQGSEQVGELICHQTIAQDLVEIFYELYLNEYQIEQIKLIDEFGGDDEKSMEANNTSCFNYRTVEGTTRLSKHALGLAIDINPYYNPYIVYQPDGKEPAIYPKGSEPYADRSQPFPYKIDTEDLCYRLFTEHGFTWGGNWNSTKDYQHFQKTP